MSWGPIDDFNEARAAGFSPTRAARWAAYRQMKWRQGEAPIPLSEAVAQVKDAKARVA